MKSSDYIVQYLVNKGIKHIYGYQGTMIAHFVDSICRNNNITNHCCYNEQGAGFAAVGSAKATGKVAVAYSTSGPGAANLISAIADAYYDSAPVVFFTGQLNTYEYMNIEGLRQNGFQEMDVVAAVSKITKYATKLENKEDIKYVLDRAFYMATEGRPGPVVIDLPMDMQRQEVDPDIMRGYVPEEHNINRDDAADVTATILKELDSAASPVLFLGNGIKNGSDAHRAIVDFAEKRQIPVITSMLGRDLLGNDHPLNFGHIGGGYGHRYANIIAYKKADLIVALGCSLCKRQTAMKTEKFAENAKIIRVDIDPIELVRKVHADEQSFLCDCNEIACELAGSKADYTVHDEWLDKCKTIKNELEAFDRECEARKPNAVIDEISNCISENTVICGDVGQHQVWISQSFKIKNGQQLLFSGGHGAMGFALPAAIGAHYGTGKKSVAICGDGAFQMNIQELQWVFREQLPLTMIVMNNSSLGLIQQQQDDIFDGMYSGSTAVGGYTSPDFAKIATAYGIASARVTTMSELTQALNTMDANKPRLIEVIIDTGSRAVPKTYFGEEMYNQRPYIPTSLMEKLLDL